MTHQLTLGQQQARDKFLLWLQGKEQVFVLEGFAGTGKTYLVQLLLEDVAAYNQLASALKLKTWKPFLTATTNAAADVLTRACRTHTSTIHKHFGFTVRSDYHTDKTFVVRSKNAKSHHHELVVVDEASYLDKDFLTKLLSVGSQCKFLFIGDPCQLPPIGDKTSSVFTSGYPTAKLDQIVRQDLSNPISQFSLGLRDHVLGSDLPDIDLVVGSLEQVSGTEFKRMMLEEFNRPDWKYTDSKYVSWTNKSAIGANRYILEHTTGTPHFSEGDVVLNNHSMPKIKTEELVEIEHMSHPLKTNDIDGVEVYIRGDRYFLPNNPSDIDTAAAKAVEEDDPMTVKYIREHWIDLRAAYACTINKAQGSTYGTVFIDLSNLSLCQDKQLKARLLYVAVSRAKNRVVLTGEY